MATLSYGLNRLPTFCTRPLEQNCGKGEAGEAVTGRTEIRKREIRGKRRTERTCRKNYFTSSFSISSSKYGGKGMWTRAN